MNARTGQTFGLTRQVIQALCAYDWPGNVRELENALQRGCALCDKNVIQLSDLPAALQACAPESEAGAQTAPATELVYPLEAPASPALKTPQVNSASGAVEPLKDFLREQELAYLNRALAQ